MNKITLYFHALKHSFIDPKYGIQVLQAKPKFSTKFFFLTSFLGMVLAAIIIGTASATFPLKQWSQDYLQQYFPLDLEVNVNQGVISINKPLPYTIGGVDLSSANQALDMLEGVNVTSPQLQQAQQLLADTQLPAGFSSFMLFAAPDQINSVEDFRQTGSLAALTPTGDLYYYSDSSRSQEVVVENITSYVANTDMSMTADLVQEQIDKFFDLPVMRYRLYAPIIALAIIVIGWPILLLILTIRLLTYSLAVWLISLLAFRNHQPAFTWGNIWQLSKHTFWLPALTSWLILNRFDLPHLWLAKFALFGIWTYLWLDQITKTATANTNQTPPTTPAVP